jgi:cytochrome c oxidase assembly factor CtaG
MGVIAHGAPLAWSLEPLQLAVVMLAAALYARRAASLRRRGRPVAHWKVACFAGALVVTVLAVVSPVDSLGEERPFFMHMLQHVLLGDVAPLLVVLGLSGPLLRPLLALRGVAPLRALAHPLVALPFWAVNLVLWHVPLLYDAALAHDALHALEHTLFFLGGALVWAAIVEPLPGPAWFGAGRKAAYLVAMWFFSLAFSQVFLWAGHPFYAWYVDAPRMWGISALADQRLGGGVMLVEGSFVMLGALIYVLLRLFAESEARQRLLDAGADRVTASRAARYGRA